MAFGIAEAFNYFRKAGITFKTIDEAYRFFIDMGFEFDRSEFFKYYREYIDATAKFRAYTKRKPSVFRYLSESIWYKEPEVIPDMTIIDSPINYRKPYTVVGKLQYVNMFGEVEEKTVSVQFDYLPTTSEIAKAFDNLVAKKREEYFIDNLLKVEPVEIRRSAMYQY